MIKQPVGFKIYTNVSIVRLKLGKGRYEIACYNNKVQDWREKKEKDINEVLQSNIIFKNAIKGDIVSNKELKHVFPSMSQEDIVKLILEKGVIQVGDKERETTTSNFRNNIAHIIVEKTYNTETGLPFTQDVIMKALKEIKFKSTGNQDPKGLALVAIKEIKDKKILPLERKKIQLLITLKNNEKLTDKEEFSQFVQNFEKYLEEIESNIIEKSIDNRESFKFKVNIKPNYYRKLLNIYENNLEFEILSNEQIGDVSLESKKKEEEGKDKVEEIETKTKELKISNAVVEKYIEDNYKEENKSHQKKRLKCTKCKGSSFENHDDLRQHCKTNWHRHNAILSAQEKPSMSAEEFDEYVLMNPEALNGNVYI